MLYLFDIDGTLMLSSGAGMRALRRAFARRHGVADGTAGIHPDGKTDPLIVTEMFQVHLGRDPEGAEVPALIAEYEGLLGAELRATPGADVLPGVRALLAELAARGEPLGLCTGNSATGARIKLEHVGLWHCFPFGGFGSDDIERSRIVRVAWERGRAACGRDFAPDEVLVIGDTPRDIAAARAVGVRVAAVATGPHSHAALAAHRPDELYANLEEMLARLPARAAS
jgi:phosphoglycolate phosphatase-like HAD superfamily hydrolase